jgi:hypothetical protein
MLINAPMLLCSYEAGMKRVPEKVDFKEAYE